VFADQKLTFPFYSKCFYDPFIMLADSTMSMTAAVVFFYDRHKLNNKIIY
jgi:hypothetical protein